jgi:hypothetical protein
VAGGIDDQALERRIHGLGARHGADAGD